MKFNRQRFLKLLTLGGLASVAAGRPASADQAPRGATVRWARLKFTGDSGEVKNWGTYPERDFRLIRFIRSKTSLDLEEGFFIADVGKLDEMVRYPFLFMHSKTPPTFSHAERANIREYLLRGGFIFADDCIGPINKKDAFFQRVAAELPKIMPEAKFERLKDDHPIFHCFFHLNNGLPYIQGIPHGAYGLTHNGRLLVLLSATDLQWAWAERNDYATTKVDQAFQMGANIYIHAMTQAG